MTLHGAPIIMAVILSLGGAARACDCPFPVGLKTNEERQAYRFRQASTVATIHIKNLSMAIEPDSDLVATSTAAVKQQLKGEITQTIRIASFGGDESANCGLASLLFDAISGSKPLTVSLEEDRSRAGTYWIGSCGYYEIGKFGSAEQE